MHHAIYLSRLQQLCTRRRIHDWREAALVVAVLLEIHDTGYIIREYIPHLNHRRIDKQPAVKDIHAIILTWIFYPFSFPYSNHHAHATRAMIDITLRLFFYFFFLFQFIFVTTILFNTRITYNGVDYPEWAVAIGWCSCLVSMLCIPGYVIFYLVFGKVISKFKITCIFRNEILTNAWLTISSTILWWSDSVEFKCVAKKNVVCSVRICNLEKWRRIFEFVYLTS